MPIRKSKGEFVCECSHCGREEYGGVEGNFLNFVEHLKDEGWKIAKDGDEWTHTCPDCADPS